MDSFQITREMEHGIDHNHGFCLEDCMVPENIQTPPQRVIGNPEEVVGLKG